MSVQSMTGFSRSEGEFGGFSWTWEVKSVNGRGLDLRFRLPPGHDALEARGRKATGAKLQRGSVSLHLALRRPDQASGFRINHDMFDQMLALTEKLREKTGSPAAQPEGILALPGVIEAIPAEEEDAKARAAREAAIGASLEVALGQLVESRREEGDRLKAMIEQHVADIERLSGDASKVAGAQPEAIRDRLREQIDALVGDDDGLPQDRLVQEVALLATRADVREEIDRLVAHVAAARDLLAADGAVGRKLDFLCQEFNREANTLCSKSPDMDLTRIGLDLKAAVDRLREQVQNVE